MIFCLECDRELPDDAEVCPDCGAEVDPEAYAQFMAAAAEAIADMDPEVREQFTTLLSQHDSAESFVNAIMIGDCVKCGSSNVLGCEHDPDIEDPCIATCHDCGTYWCTECGEVLKPEEFETHDKSCPGLAELAEFLAEMEDGEEEEDEEEEEEEAEEEDEEEEEEEEEEEWDVVDRLFELPDTIFSEEEWQTLVAAREEITPGLLEMLRTTAQEFGTLPEDSEDLRPLYAALLLGYFRDTRAHEPLLDILSRLDVEALFGDLLTDSIPYVLMRTYPGTPDGLVSLLGNSSAYVYSRSAAAVAMAGLVAEGRLDRAVAVEALAKACNETLLKRDHEMASLCVMAATDLHPKGLMPVLMPLFEADLVDPDAGTVEELAAEDARDPEEAYESLLQGIKRRHPEDDFYAWVSGWFGADDFDIADIERALAALANSKPKRKKKKAKKRSAERKARNQRKKKRKRKRGRK